MNRLRRRKRNEYGQALLEVLLSFAVITIVLVAVVSRATEAARNAAFARNEVLAARFAQEGIEWSRAQRDQMGWEAFEAEITQAGYPDPVVFCVLDISNALDSLTPGACVSFIGTTIFDRNVQIDHNTDGVGENYVIVQVTVSWSDSVGVHDAQYTTRLSNWQI